MSIGTHHLLALLPAAAPLLLASTGALVSEHAGVLAVFMDGAITIAAFICVDLTFLTGSPVVGIIASVCITMLLLFLASLFTEKTQANPFIVALAINLLSQGLTSYFAMQLFGTRGTYAVAQLKNLSLSRNIFFPFSFLGVMGVALFLKYSLPGIRIRGAGSSPAALTARAYSPATYRSLSWLIAAFFASCAGCMLSIDLGAWVPNVSAGRGWTALAAVYLGYKNPYLCTLAVLLFAGAEYATNILQGLGKVSATLILGLPYALAFLVFVFTKTKKELQK